MKEAEYLSLRKRSCSEPKLVFYNFTIILVINPVHQNVFGLVEMTYRLVHASYSLPKWQAVKLPFFAPWFKFLRSRIKFICRFSF